jgi:hypothetical protein
MFGYIKLDNYSPSKYRDYFTKNYCFLCRALDRHYGFFSRLFVSFDVTFFTILFSEDGYLSNAGKIKCFKTSKIQKERLNDEFAKKIAAFNLALAAGELKDNIDDKDKFYAKIAYSLYKGVFKKVKKDYPLMWDIIEQGHKEMCEIEKRNGALEEIENCFAHLVERVIREVFLEKDESKISYIKYVAKMLYFMDAVDDIDKDIKRNSFNPLKHFGSKADYVFANYKHLKNHLDDLRAELIPLESKSINALTIKRIIEVGVPERLIKVCYRGVKR